MANEYYATTGSPATSSQGASATMRSEFTSVAAGFDKLPTLAGNGSKLVQINSGGTALTAIALTVGALLFGGAAGVLGQDGTNLFWDNTAKRLGIGNAAPSVALDVTGAGKFSAGLTVSAGGITATGNSTITGTLGGVTTLTASTSVVTPAVSAVGALFLSSGAGGALQFSSGTGVVSCNSDNTTIFGDSTHRWITGFFTSIDSGTGASLFLRTGNGNNSFEIIQAGAGSVNWWGASGQATGVTPFLGVRGETNVTGVLQGNRGTGTFRINDGITNATQFEFLSAPAATRWITSSASTTNPTLGVTGGSLAITPAVVLGSSLNFSTAAGKIIPGATSMSLRNNADSSDNLVIVDAGNATLRGSLAWGTGVANFGTITKRKTADESVTSSTVLQDDDHLTFAIAANEEWVATFQIDAGNALNLTGFQAAVTVPSGATLNVTLAGNPAQTGGSYSQRTTTSGSGLNSVAAGFSSSGSGVFIVTVWVLNGATLGSVTLQWAQGTSSGTALTFRKGSFLQATRVA